jgi:hypothetical protein
VLAPVSELVELKYEILQAAIRKRRKRKLSTAVLRIDYRMNKPKAVSLASTEG